jgi:hypothetical protein
MRIRHFWLLIVLTGLALAGQPAAQGYRDSNKNSGLEQHLRSKIDFELYRDYLIVVHGSVGPLKGLNFLFDTGASPSVLDPRIAAKLHLTTAPTDIAILEGTVQGQTAIAPSIQLGSLQTRNLPVQNFPVLIRDLSFLQNALPLRIDGIVGLDVLGQSTFVIDYASREIRFGASSSIPDLIPGSIPDSIPFHMQQGLAIVDATINHTPVHLLLDTGAPSLILFKDMPDPTSGSKAVLQRASKTIGSFDRKHVQSINLKLGETEFGHEAAFVVLSPKDAGHNFDGLISPAALGITRVAVDPSHGKLTLTRNP